MNTKTLNDVQTQMVSDLIASLAKEYPGLVYNSGVNPRQLPVPLHGVEFYPNCVIHWHETPEGFRIWCWEQEEEQEPEEFAKIFNISNSVGTYMLLHNVCRHDANTWLKHYQRTYPAGKPYPNGEGEYPDFGFHIVRVA